MQELKVRYLKNYKLNIWGKLEYENPSDSGFDIRAAIDHERIISPRELTILEYHESGIDNIACPGIQLIPTGIKMEIPEGYELQIRPRSGLAAKHGITVLNTPATIDSGYKNEIKVILINLGTAQFIVKPGMRIAQAVLCPVIQACFKTVKRISKKNDRGGGFGHTGNF